MESTTLLANRERRLRENKERKQKVAAWIENYRNTHPCVTCGESDTRCLDFHHRNPKLKEIEVTAAVVHGWSVQRLMTEVIKCDILCANCHRKYHRGSGIAGNTLALHA